MSEQSKIIGLMGCGTVADYGHIPAIKATPGLTLGSIYDPNPANLERIQKKYGVPHAFTDAGAFFASGIEAVSITSPAPCHKENVVAAAARGLPVLCEKPLAMNATEASEMVEAMKKAGAPLHTAFCYRFSPSALKIHDLVRENAIGTVRSLRLIYNWGMHGKFAKDKTGRAFIQQRRHLRMLEGGPMVDCGAHQIDLARFWLGSEVIRYSAHGAWVDEYEAPDHLWLHMDHDNGAHTMVEMSYSYHHTTKNRPHEFVYELIGTQGVIRYDDTAKVFRLDNASGSRDLEFHDVKSFEGMYREWAESLVSGKSGCLASGEDGMRVVDIARNATDLAIRSRTAQATKPTYSV